MPTYVYKFLDSGETIEVQQAFSDPTLNEHPHPADGSLRPVKKVFLPVGVTFKGGGFYKTDSRGGSSSSTTAAGSSASSTESSGSSGSSGSNGASDSSSTSSASSSSTPATSSSGGSSAN